MGIRKYVRKILLEIEDATSSVLPDDEYKIPLIPFPEHGTEEEKSDLMHVIQQYNDRAVPDFLQEPADEDMVNLFVVFLDDKNLSFNVSYIRKLKESLTPIIISLKEYYDRPRPQEIAKSLGINFCADYLESAQTPSYPSGHTIQAYVIALSLSEQFPELEPELLSIADLVSQSRIDRGVHFPSDIDYGKKIAHIIFTEMRDGSSS